MDETQHKKAEVVVDIRDTEVETLIVMYYLHELDRTPREKNIQQVTLHL